MIPIKQEASVYDIDRLMIDEFQIRMFVEDGEIEISKML
jgi:hypothetical protein